MHLAEEGDTTTEVESQVKVGNTSRNRKKSVNIVVMFTVEIIALLKVSNVKLAKVGITFNNAAKRVKTGRRKHTGEDMSMK